MLKAIAFNVSPKTVGKWVRRYQQSWSAGLMDRSSRPHCSRRHQSPAFSRPATVARCELKHSGDLIHFDIKRLARFDQPGHRVTGVQGKESRSIGYKYLHMVIEDHSRVAFAAILPGQIHHSAIWLFFLARTHFNRFDFSIWRVLTDDGSCYKQGIFRKLLRLQNVKPSFTWPYTALTNGEVERFIQTCLREWAYTRSYMNYAQRENLD
jgi:transposase InsO family protein